jgi:hypothetical protein
MRLAFGAVAGLLGLLAANTAQAQSLNVAFSNDANSSFTASTGDVFAFTGYSGSTTLVSGVSQTLTLAAVTENLGCCWNNTVYNNTVAEDITLNGVTDSTSQLWSVDDVEDPTTSVAESNTLVFAVDGGTVASPLRSP